MLGAKNFVAWTLSSVSHVAPNKESRITGTPNQKIIHDVETLSSLIEGNQNNANREDYDNSVFRPYVYLLVNIFESGKSTC
jgi:hypothetical protein